MPLLASGVLGVPANVGGLCARFAESLSVIRCKYSILTFILSDIRIFRPTTCLSGLPVRVRVPVAHPEVLLLVVVGLRWRLYAIFAIFGAIRRFVLNLFFYPSKSDFPPITSISFEFPFLSSFFFFLLLFAFFR